MKCPGNVPRTCQLDFFPSTFLNKMCRLSKFEYFIFYTTYFGINKQQLEPPEALVTDVSEEHGVENSMETGYTVVKVDVQMILLGLSAIFYLGLFIFLFQREVSIFLCIQRPLHLSEMLFNHDSAVFL